MSSLPETSAETRRLLFLALGVVVLLILLHFTPMKAWTEDVQLLKLRVQSFGWAGTGVFAVVSMAAISLGVPRLLLCGLAGMLFGFVTGAIVALVASVPGAYGAFLLARWSGRDWADRKLATASEGLRELLSKPSLGAIFVARQLPMPGLVINVALGVLPTTHRTFLLGSFLGYLPSTAIVALAGSSLGKDNLEAAITQVSLSMAGLAVLSIVLMWVRRRMAG